MPSRRGRGRPAHPDLLTPAEWEVLDWVRHGLRRADIARRRGTSVDAVKYHLANIGGKLGVSSRELRHWPGMPAVAGAPRRRHRPPMTTPSSGSAGTALGRIGQVSLDIRDVARAERFYGTTLGLPHVFTFGDLAFFDAGGTRLYLHRKDEEEWRPGSTLYFVVDDIAAAQESLGIGRRPLHRRTAPDPYPRRRDRGVDDVLRGRRGQHAGADVGGAPGVSLSQRAGRPRSGTGRPSGRRSRSS